MLNSWKIEKIIRIFINLYIITIYTNQIASPKDDLYVFIYIIIFYDGSSKFQAGQSYTALAILHQLLQ